MIDTLYGHRLWVFAGLVVSLTGAVMLAWVLNLLTGPTYAGVSTVREVINRNGQVMAPEIAGDVRISQTFVASEDDLEEVGILLDTFDRVNTEPIDFTLSDGNGQVQRAVQADPVTIHNFAYHPFVFDPIPDSRGKTYTATISSAGAEPGNAFATWLGNCDCYPEGIVSINGNERPDQELVMRVDYHHQGVVVWRELINRMSQYKPEIVKGAGLVLLGVLSTTLALATLGAVVTSPGASEGERMRPLWIAVSVIVAMVVVLLTGAYEEIGSGG
ncbi:MAG TPA: hypothetical protein VFO59_09830 [Dehalococcoidia bacterium]|nr:hypothetical protein [Dehalococcoidia bacterium]